MITRVTTQTQVRAAQTSLATNLSRLTQLQEQATTLKTFTRASDDPAKAADSLAVRAAQSAVTQYSRNTDNGNGWLTTVDSALGSATDILNAVRDVTVQGGNGALSPAAKSALAAQLQGLKQDLLGQANTPYLGRSVFAGSSDAGAAFTNVAGTLTFTGNPASTVLRRIGADAQVRVDSNGDDVFGAGGVAGADSVFALIDHISNALDASTGVAGTGTTASDYLGAVETRLTGVIAARSDAGVRHALITNAGEALVKQAGTLEATRSGIEDADLGQAVLDLKLQEVSYQAALSVTAKVLQHTLMDFLQ